jgi:DNA repair protein RadC
MVVLAHNHPSGLPIPSAEDLATTNEILRAFRSLEVRMLAHIIVAGDQYVDILTKNFRI